MPTTDRHGFELWEAGFTQSDTILNDLLLKLEVKVGASVLDRDLNEPAGGESDGDMYIVGSSPTGAWASFTAGDVVILRESTWYNFTPRRGATAMVEDESNIMVGWTGSAWTTVSVSQAYVDAAVAGLFDHKGGYNASTNTPDLDTSPSGVLKGDVYIVTADGDFFTEPVQIGDTLIADVDSASSLGDWTILESNAPKNNDAATTDPGTGDDDADGYSPGSRWTNVTDDTVWFCLDASTGAAVWQEVEGNSDTQATGESLLLNSQFKAWNLGTSVAASDGSGVHVADRWICKYTLAGSSCTVSRLDQYDGGANLSFSCSAAEYFYMRQYIPGLQQFSGKQCTVIADVETAETDLLYDWYILGRYNSDSGDRVTIVDSTNTALPDGRNKLSLTFTMPTINPTLYTKNEDNSVEFAFRIVTAGAKTAVVKIHSLSFVLGNSDVVPFCDPVYESAKVKQFYEISGFTTGVGGLTSSSGQKRVFFPMGARKRLGQTYSLSYADAAGNPNKVSTYDLAGARTDDVTPTAVSKADTGFIVIINSSTASGIGCSWAIDSDFLV